MYRDLCRVYLMKKRKKRKAKYTIYSDGGCISNPGGQGAYGTIVVNSDTGEIKQFAQGYQSTTNNRMEILGIIAGLQNVPRNCSCTIVSDSQLAIKCLTGQWKRNKNLDLWNVVERLCEGKKISTKWVKGHNGDVLNELCDRMATVAMNGKNLLEDAGYIGKRQHKKGMELKVPDTINENILYDDRAIDCIYTNEVCRENIARFKERSHKTFRDYINLKTNGIDGWSGKTLIELLNFPDANDAWIVIAENIDGYSQRLSALRWFLRGLSLEDAIMKVNADGEIKRGNDGH